MFGMDAYAMHEIYTQMTTHSLFEVCHAVAYQSDRYLPPPNSLRTSVHMRTLVHRAGQQRSRSRRTRIAALWPAAPITEPAGWQPAEHEYSPAIGVTYGSRSAKPNPLST